MGRRDRANPSLTAALCVSMTVHALAMSAVCWWFVTHGPPTWLAGPTPAEVERHHPAPPPPPPRPKKRKAAPPPPPPPPPAYDESQPFHDDSGEHAGHGTANRSTAGDRPMQAPRGYEQAELARSKPPDPSLIDPTAARAAQAGRPVPEDALPVPPVAPSRGTVHPDLVATAAPAHADPAGSVQPKAAAAHALGPLPTPATLTPPTEDVPPPTPTGVRQATAPPSVSVAPPPPARATRGRQAVASDTESVPFAKDATVVFHAGRMDARQGMVVEVTQPRWGLASEDDLAALGELHAVFGVYVRPDGSVARIVVLQSSGSSNVDLDCERALYAGTLEARRDKGGHPVATLWTVVYN